MKQLILGLFLIALSFSAKSQNELLGKSPKEISEAANYIDLTLVKTSNTESGVPYLLYRDNKIKSIHLGFYFNKDSTSCISVILFDKKENMISRIEKLNRQYEKVGPHTWVNDNNDIKIELEYEKGAISFSVRYTRII